MMESMKTIGMISGMSRKPIARQYSLLNITTPEFVDLSPANSS